MLSEPWSAPTLLGLGLAFGLRHALDADHLAAVATIASGKRTVLQSGIVGAVWGLGHTAALLVVGAVVLALQLQIPEPVAAWLEMGVAVMLVALGVRALLPLVRAGGHAHAHAHGDVVHVHPHRHGTAAGVNDHDDHRRPFAIGVVHGLAGSAALLLLVVSATPSPWLGLAYILAFGAGSIGGMVAMSALVGLPAALTAERFRGAHTAVRGAAAVLSIGVGAALGWEVWGSLA